jgi:hypothetical protein
VGVGIQILGPYLEDATPIGWLTVPVVAFLALVYAQRRLGSKLSRAERLIEYYERGLARLEGRWAGTGDTGTRLAPSVHPYALDLDVFVTGSLFERLSTARTASGARTLADWLRALLLIGPCASVSWFVSAASPLVQTGPPDEMNAHPTRFRSTRSDRCGRSAASIE